MPGAPAGGLAQVLEELAGDGPALELGVGTGRIALPLAERGVEVHGIDASEAVLAKLRAKPGGETIQPGMQTGDSELANSLRAASTTDIRYGRSASSSHE